MPHTSVVFTPGLQKDDSPLASEGGWIDGDKVRFVRVGESWRPQTIGGWESLTTDTFTGIARGSHAWADLTGRRYVAWGTATSLYALIGGTKTDITPPHSEGVLTNPFTTTNTSAVVTVTHTSHGLATGASVTFSNQSSTVGGLTLNGTYTVTVSDDNTYTFTAGSAATSSATGGGNVDYSYALAAGLVDGIGEPGGYGTGTYGSGGYGTTTAADKAPRIWYLDNWGRNLVACPSGGGLYEFQPSTTYPELVTNGDFNAATGWTTGAGWAISGGIATVAVAGASSDLSQAVTLEAGRMYRLRVDVSRTAGSFTIQFNTGTTTDLSMPISAAGSYSRLFRAPAGATTLRFTKDTSWVGFIDNASIKLESIAYRVDEAPAKNLAMFVDPHQLVVLLGTTPYLGTYQQMGVRWSGYQDITSWTPTLATLAGDNILGQGSRLVGGLATRQQNILWTDTAAYSMVFTNDARKPFQIDLLGTGCGLIGGLARSEHNGVVFWASTDNFYQSNGGAPAPIRSTLRRDFFGHIAENQGSKIVAGVLPSHSEVWFFSPDSRDGTEVSRYATFRWDEGHWTAGTMPRTAWIKPGLYEYPIAFGTDGGVYWHEKGTSANGAVLTAYLESAYTDIGDGDKLMVVKRIIGDFDDLQGAVNFTLYGRMWPNGTEVTYGPFQHTSSSLSLPCRALARQMKVRLDSSATPSFWRLGALRMDIEQTGARR